MFSHGNNRFKTIPDYIQNKLIRKRDQFLYPKDEKRIETDDSIQSRGGKGNLTLDHN